MSVFSSMVAEGLLSPPDYLPAALQYEVLMGSHAFGTANADSDRDIFGVCITDEESNDWMWAQMQDRQYPAFTHIEAGEPVRPGAPLIGCDLVIHSLYNFLVKCREGRAMTIEMLFVADENVLHCTPGGKLLRDNRDLYICKSTVRGMLEWSETQLTGMIERSFQPEKRRKYEELYGYDVKAGYHSVRLLHQAKQVLIEGKLDLKSNAAMLLEIRRGDWPEADLVAHCKTLSEQLHVMLHASALPDSPPWEPVRDMSAAILAGAKAA